MPLSGMPSVAGLSLPAGCTNVKIKNSAADPSASNNKVDVTTLVDDQRQYASAPLIDAGSGADGGLTTTVTASFFVQAESVPTVTPPPTPPAVDVGWVCTEVEIEYAVGDFVKGTATYVFKAGGGE